jgi:hypothetical protein
MTTNGSVDIDDAHAVSFAVRRLRVIADELETVKDRRDALYSERMALVYQLRGTVSQQDLALACRCGVDMIKNISASARRKGTV